MIAVDIHTAGALELVVRDYLATNEGDRALTYSLIGGARIEVPLGLEPAERGAIADLYDRIAHVGDGYAMTAASTGDELALRRAAAHLRHGARLLRGGGESVTRRIPTIPLAEAAGRLRAGKHRDSEPPATRPLMERAGFAQVAAGGPRPHGLDDVELFEAIAASDPYIRGAIAARVDEATAAELPPDQDLGGES